MNKIKKIIISAIVAMSVGGSAVSADVIPYKLQLSEYILKVGVLRQSEMDTNRDGSVNVLDLVRHKQQVIYPEVTTIVTTTVTTTEITTTTPVETPPPVTIAPPSNPPAVEHKIYVTRTGKKYHYDNTCNGGDYYESTLEEALARGLTPCKKCTY